MARTNNLQVTSATRPDSLASRTALHMRKKMYAQLRRLTDLDNVKSILDVGVTSDRERLDSNFLEMLYPHPERITALSDQDAAWLANEYAGLQFVRGDGCDLQFADNSFELVFSSAVLEHVGAADRQRKFIAESFRVCSKYLFLTTPNRFHPLEFHTALPLLHWLPKEVHRKILRMIGFRDFAAENVLNLCSRRDLCEMAETLGDFRIDALYFLGFPSNYMLFINKKQENFHHEKN